MKHLKILGKHERAEIENKLKKQFGIKEIPGMLIKSGTERIFLYQGSLTEKEILTLDRDIPLERIGVYFAKMQGWDFRLSIEGAQVLKPQITKNIFKLNEEQAEQWMHGSELNLKPPVKGFLIMDYNGDYLGTGKASEEKITNFIPKSRRLKFKN